MDFALSKPSNLAVYGLDYTCFKLRSCNNVIVKDDSDIPVLKIYLDLVKNRIGLQQNYFVYGPWMCTPLINVLQGYWIEATFDRP